MGGEKEKCAHQGGARGRRHLGRASVQRRDQEKEMETSTTPDTQWPLKESKSLRAPRAEA